MTHFTARLCRRPGAARTRGGPAGRPAGEARAPPRSASARGAARRPRPTPGPGPRARGAGPRRRPEQARARLRSGPGARPRAPGGPHPARPPALTCFLDPAGHLRAAPEAEAAAPRARAAAGSPGGAAAARSALAGSTRLRRAPAWRVRAAACALGQRRCSAPGAAAAPAPAASRRRRRRRSAFSAAAASSGPRAGAAPQPPPPPARRASAAARAPPAGRPPPAQRPLPARSRSAPPARTQRPLRPGVPAPALGAPPRAPLSARSLRGRTRGGAGAPSPPPSRRTQHPPKARAPAGSCRLRVHPEREMIPLPPPGSQQPLLPVHLALPGPPPARTPRSQPSQKLQTWDGPGQGSVRSYLPTPPSPGTQ